MKKLAKNTISSLVYQISTLICGFILPGLILSAFGSEVNGLVNSITQFLRIITLLDLGVGTVVEASFYKPLAQKDDVQISIIAASANKFFSTVIKILLVYVVVLTAAYPFIVVSDFNLFYSGSLIIIISISTFAQYYFGIVNRLLLNADQKGYIQYNTQTITLILNTIVSVIMIKCGASIHIVKLSTSVIFLARPLYLYYYVEKNYNINRKVSVIGEPIKQKWNGVAQHIASVVLDSTDTVVLSLFSTLTNVSIYSVYFLVVSGVRQLMIALMAGCRAVLGDFWAKKEIDNFRCFFDKIEWIVHTSATYVWSCTLILILPFVSVYTKHVSDANYIVPAFAMLLVTAYAMHSYRIPYNIAILATGHFKQTQNMFFVTALLNIIISIILVKRFGLIGVAIGTIVAMTCQTLYMAHYDYKVFLHKSLLPLCKQFGVDFITVFISFVATKGISIGAVTYHGWVILAVKVGIIVFVVTLGINMIFYRLKTIAIIKKAVKR